ncbi:cytoskeleton-associated protein 2-like isoform X2 [Lineus longissimus]|uniref:cytoskeleton-associated protein 2-like isoform X2 n=1 Tax=Lineus longissimus TaxID=88925 RepID=UPI002B4FAD48
MDSQQELLKQKLQMWREAKTKPGIASSKPGRQKPVKGNFLENSRPVIAGSKQAGKKPILRGTQLGNSLPTLGTQHLIKPIERMNLNKSKTLGRTQKSFPAKKPVQPKQDLKQKIKLPATTMVQIQGKEHLGTDVLKTQMMTGNIPKALPSATVRSNAMNAKGIKRLSRNFTAINKVNQNVRGKVQSACEGITMKRAAPMRDRLKSWREKKEMNKVKTAERPKVPENKLTKSIGRPHPSSFVASSKKLNNIIQSYVSSDKKSQENGNKTPKTPSNPRRAKRPLNFSTNEASAKRARHLSISKSVSRLADTPGTPNPRASGRTPRRTPKNAMEDEQHHMREKLESWLKAHGKTPERHRHATCYHGACEEPWRDPVQLASPGLDECQLARQKTVLDHEDIAREVKKHIGTCMEKYQEGVLAETVLLELESRVGQVSSGRTVSSYWLCKARLMEDLGNDAQTVEVYDEAMKSGAEPKMDILKALHNFTTRLLQFDMEGDKDHDAKRKAQTEKKKPRRSVRIMEVPLTMPKKMSRVQHQVDEDNIINSSAVKFSVSSCTPLMKNLRLNDDDNSPKCYVVTPVRRSTRKSFTDLPRMLQDHDEVIDNLDDLSDHKKNKMLYNDNRNLSEKLDFDSEDEEEEGSSGDAEKEN